MNGARLGDGKNRFDLETGHCAETPALRRINAPHKVSEAFFSVMSDSAMTDMVADLIGPDAKLHRTGKFQLPARRPQKWRRFSFAPHTNEDLVTALLMVDEVTENGPLEVWAGTHGHVHNLWHEDKFTGAVGAR